MEGSLGYAVMVPKDHLNEAKKVLLEDSELRRPWFTILENGAISKSVLEKE